MEKHQNPPADPQTTGETKPRPQVPSLGRIVHVFSEAFDGPRAAIITGVFGTSHESAFNAQVFLDGCNDKAVEHNHFTSIQIHDGEGEKPARYAIWPPRV